MYTLKFMFPYLLQMETIWGILHYCRALNSLGSRGIRSPFRLTYFPYQQHSLVRAPTQCPTPSCGGQAGRGTPDPKSSGAGRTECAEEHRTGKQAGRVQRTRPTLLRGALQKRRTGRQGAKNASGTQKNPPETADFDLRYLYPP